MRGDPRLLQAATTRASCSTEMRPDLILWPKLFALAREETFLIDSFLIGVTRGSDARYGPPVVPGRCRMFGRPLRQYSREYSALQIPC
jgi:hypothetical protein